jgi:hypothetical protein
MLIRHTCDMSTAGAVGSDAQALSTRNLCAFRDVPLYVHTFSQIFEEPFWFKQPTPKIPILCT